MLRGLHFILFEKTNTPCNIGESYRCGIGYPYRAASIHHYQRDRYINDILTALSTYSNIVGHVHGLALKRPPYCVHKYFMPQHVLSRNSRKNQNSGWFIDILQCNLWAS